MLHLGEDSSQNVYAKLVIVPQSSVLGGYYSLFQVFDYQAKFLLDVILVSQNFHHLVEREIKHVLHHEEYEVELEVKAEKLLLVDKLAKCVVFTPATHGLHPKDREK